MKKVLAWAVVLALVLSSFTMAFAGQTKTSADFSDASEINYTEAVDVMVATGIINGYPDGTFGPAKTVKRSEMAKMIACIMNGGEDVGDQYKSGCPFADSKDHWAAGYIAYCASEHIIDGRSADVFDPEAEVTGTEVAKMALTSLGYDSGIQGYTGENWATNVLKDAKKNNLFKGLDKSFVPGDPCNRESAAQILFNMLKAPMVEYDTNTSVTVGDATVTVNSKVNKIVADEERDPQTGEPLEGETGYVELYEEVFGGELAKDDAKGDDFGNPGHTWTYPDEDTVVGTYTDSAEYEFVAEAEGFGDALAAFDEGLGDQFSANPKEIAVAKVTVNGAQGAEANVCLGDKVKMYEADAPEVLPEGTNADTAWYDVVVEQYVAYQISEVNTEDIDSKDAKKGVTALVTFQQDENFVGVPLEEVKNTAIVGYDESTYVEDAVVAIALKGNTIIDSYVMEELASGEITKINKSTGAVTIGGTAYDPATKYNAVDGVEFAIEGEYTLYDYNGFALASVEVAPPEEEAFYGMITDAGYSYNTEIWSSDESEGTLKLKIFTAEGKSEVYAVDADYAQTASRIIGSLDYFEPMLVTYEFNDDNEISKIVPANEETEGMSDEGMATGGVLYGREVSDDVVGFAYDEAAEEWITYDFAALEAADTVNIESFIDEDGAQLLAIYCGTLAAPKTEVLGFLTGVTKVENTDGTAYELTAYVNGKEEAYTTVAGKDENEPADPSEYKYSLAKFTFDGDLVEAVEFADCIGAEKASADIPDGYDATFYGDATSTSALSGVKEVIGIDSSSLNVGSNTSTGNNYQACTGATVYCVEMADGAVSKVSVSSIDKIKKGNYVILMKTSNDSKVWDVVLYSTTNPLP